MPYVITEAPAPPKLYTAPEAAKILKVSTAYVRQAIHEGRLSASRIGAEFRIDHRALIDYLRSTRKTARVKAAYRDPRRRARDCQVTSA